MKNLVFGVVRYENYVLVRVLEQHESLRGVRNICKWLKIRNPEFYVESNLYPEIKPDADEIYIRGKIRSKDNDVVGYGFPSVSSAIDFVRKLAAITKEINKHDLSVSDSKKCQESVVMKISPNDEVNGIIVE